MHWHPARRDGRHMPANVEATHSHARSILITNTQKTFITMKKKIEELNCIRLSRNFTLGELVHSDVAEKLQLDNMPPLEAVVNLTLLVHCLLQPLRDHVRQAIRVNSGYRSPEVNRVVGGVKNSQHMVGMAADITLGGKQKNCQLWRELKDGPWPFDQAILEKGGQWLHLSFNIQNNRRKAFELG